MADTKDTSKIRQIKVLTGVLSAGLGFGVVIALGMLYWYNPTGSYSASHTLLDPANAFSLHFAEPGSKGKTEGRYIFDGMQFSVYEINHKKTISTPVNQEQYAALYHKIANEKSLVAPGQEIQHLFHQGYPATLELKVRMKGEDLSKGIETIFSKIEFTPNGDYYRVQLRQSTPGSEWIYFYHPGIYQEVYNIFNESHD